MKRKVNSISDAIDELCEYSFNLDSPIGITDETARLARIALREQEEREKGCEYCLDDEDNEPENIGTGLNMFGQECKLLMHEDEPICVIRFCPRCGRKLDGGGQDARKGDSDER